MYIPSVFSLKADLLWIYPKHVIIPYEFTHECHCTRNYKSDMLVRVCRKIQFFWFGWLYNFSLMFFAKLFLTDFIAEQFVIEFIVKQFLTEFIDWTISHWIYCWTISHWIYWNDFSLNLLLNNFSLNLLNWIFELWV